MGFLAPTTGVLIVSKLSALALSFILITSLIAISGAQQTFRVHVIIPPTISSLKSYISHYIPNNVIANSLFINESVGAANYVIFQINSTGDNYVVFNLTNLTVNNQSFVLDQATNFKVLQPYLVKKYYPSSSTLSNLTKQLQRYQSSSQLPLTDCLTEAGLNNYMCPASINSTQCIQRACQGVPVCFKVLNGVGINSPFARGIYNFSLEYQALNNSYNQYYAVATGISPNNIGSSLVQLSSIINNISALSALIPQNPIFPPPTNISINQVQSVCSNYEAGQSGGPWYCYSLGFCENTNFNASYIGNVQTQIYALSALPLTNASIQTVVATSINNGAKYFYPKYSAQQQQIYNSIINSVAPEYNSLMANITFLNAKFQNASLGAALATITSVYNTTRNAGINQNLSSANALLLSTYATELKAYNKVAAIYVPVYLQAYNSTNLLLLHELDYQTPPPSISALAARQSAINAKLNTYITANGLAQISSQIASINYQTSGITPPYSTAAIVRRADGGAITGILAPSAIPISAKLQSAPLYAFAISLGIGILAMILIYLLTYQRLSKKRKLQVNPKVKRAWTMLFITIFVLVLVYAFVTYSYAQSANSFLPISGFVSSIDSANTVYILVNQSIASNYTTQQCIAALDATLKTQAPVVYVVNVSNGGTTCTSPINSSIKGTQCLNNIYASDQPAIFINPSNSSSSTITYKGMYGDVLYASGPATQGPSCVLNGIIKVS